MNTQVLKGLLAVSAFGLAMQASAYGTNDYGTNVTINDGLNDSGNSGGGIGEEDTEVEPGTNLAQKWDMEGFFLDDQSLTMIGGFDYENGNQNFDKYTAGDIFLAVGVVPDYGTRAARTTDGITEAASPFQYVSEGDTTSESINSGSFDITTATDEETGFEGDNFFQKKTHFVLSGIDLSELMEGATSGENTFYSHFTMGCGNDNLMGSWTVDVAVPEPGAIALFSTGLFGLWFARRKQRADAPFSA